MSIYSTGLLENYNEKFQIVCTPEPTVSSIWKYAYTSATRIIYWFIMYSIVKWTSYITRYRLIFVHWMKKKTNCWYNRSSVKNSKIAKNDGNTQNKQICGNYPVPQPRPINSNAHNWRSFFVHTNKTLSIVKIYRGISQLTISQ